MKLDMMLTELGYKPSGAPPRLGVYLTNSLEEGEPANQTLPFAQWLSQEVKAANTVKRDMPIMCVIGNPPYSGVSQNNGKWITDLIEDYKKEPGGKEKLKEKKHWLNDDYVKFIRLSEHFITKNETGVLGFITNHGYLDNPTFRGMRWHLMKSFDKIYVLDLHGNSNKKETAPDGSKDVNVFDIQQGVGIIIAVKTGKKKKGELAEVFHQDMYGARKDKYATLEAGSLYKDFVNLEAPAPNYFFVPKDFELQKAYGKGFSVSEIFDQNVSGIVTSRDDFVIDENRYLLERRVHDFADRTLTSDQFQTKYSLSENYQWKLEEQRQLVPPFDKNNFYRISYRLFDERWIYYQDNLVFRRRQNVMRHFTAGENWGLLTPKITADDYACFVSKGLIVNKAATRYDQTYDFPLYLYPDENAVQADAFADTARQPNFDAKLVTKFAKFIGLKFVPDHEIEGAGAKGTFHPLDLFDYIYGVLHSPKYRETYKEFLKIDFPRVPYPESEVAFWKTAAHGGALRKLHLMEDEAIGKAPYPFEGEGDNIVENPTFDGGRVFINDVQSFANVPEIAWNFYIGGYQPAQKWLKDRKGRELSFEDIMHYQKIIKILSETDRVMKEIG